MDNYIILLHSFIHDNVNTPNNKYEYNKLLSFLFLDLYNDNMNEDKYFNAFNKGITKLGLNSIDFKKMKFYKLHKIKVGKTEENDRIKYKYKLIFYENNIRKKLFIMTEILKNNIIFSSKKKIDKILLLYTILGLNTGLFWGVDPRVYDYVMKVEPNSIECFASPFNHMLDNYYSLLDIDKKFGSSGNFFEKFMESKYNVYLINPPFTEDIISRVFIEIEKKLEKDKSNFAIYLYVPKWDDINIPFYNKTKSKFHVMKHDLLSGQSSVYDHINMKNIVNKFNLTVFCLTNHMNQTYQDIFNAYVLKP